MLRNMVKLFLGVSCLTGGRYIASLVHTEVCQVAYIGEGLVRFDSVGVESVREYSPAFPEHSWVVATAEEGCDVICVSWHGVVSVEKAARFSSGRLESKTASEAAAVDAV